MDVIGQGSYGCVHKKPIKCEDPNIKIDYRDKISKLMKTKYADSEMSEYALIENVDPKHRFHMDPPIKCSPNKSKLAFEAIDKCDDFNHMDIDKYKLLIMPDGGVNLNDYAKSKVSRKMIEIFWIESHRIFYGLKIMSDARIIHHDFKPHNIVFNTKTKRTNFIDFGFINNTDSLIQKCDQSQCSDGVAHWSFPYEFRFINKADYLNALRHRLAPNIHSDEQFRTFIEYVTKPGESREHFKSEFSNSVADMFKHDLKSENYRAFMKKSLETTDVYSVGLTFLYVLNKFESKMDPSFVYNLRQLFHHMVLPRVSLRITATEAISKYESILTTSGLMAKHRKTFDIAMT